MNRPLALLLIGVSVFALACVQIVGAVPTLAAAYCAFLAFAAVDDARTRRTHPFSATSFVGSDGHLVLHGTDTTVRR